MTAALPNMHDAISRRAAAFFERRSFGGWNDADQAEFDAWLAESRLHRAAYLRVEGIIAHTKRLVSLAPGEFRSAAPVTVRNIAARRFALPLLAAASIASIAVFGASSVRSLMQSPASTYSTEVGGRTLLNFADHTQIELNTDTVVRFRMTTTERTVWLEKGEAWFNVAHNAANPFTVVVGKRRITDLGTEFVVRRETGGMEVALLNGRAALSADGAPTTMLAPGDDAVAAPGLLSVTRKSRSALADELAWRRGVLVFRNTRLADAVREFNRYNTTKLVIADPSIANVKVYAELKTDDFEDLLQLAQTMLKLHVEREGNVILISRATREETRGAAPTKRSL